MFFRHDDGREMTLKQVVDIAWQQFGADAVLAEFGAVLSWNARYAAPDISEQLAADAATLLQIAERLKQWEA